MTSRNAAELLLLGALWGASFMFMRVGAPEFGPLALVFVRVGGAALLLVPIVLWRGDGGVLRRHWRTIAVVGVVNSALPFALYATAALTLPAGVLAGFNATVPIWGALVAVAWLREPLGPWRAAGLVVGFAGAIALAAYPDGGSGAARVDNAVLASAACLAATLAYGIGANLTRRWLLGVPPLAVAGGSQLAAAVVMLPAAAATWPQQPPSAAAWTSAALLAVACTGAAYVLYYRLVAHTGAAAAVSVTYLIPVFALLWGWLVLGERPQPAMLAACAVILLGTALASGWLRGPARAAKRGRAT